MRVMKFGGSSLEDGALMRRVATIVADAPGIPVVVASAMAGVTDHLLETAERARGSEDVIPPFLAELRARHEDALEEAAGDGEAAIAREEIAPVLEKLERLLYGIAYTEELTPRTRDLVVSFGERLSVRTLAAVLRTEGIPAQGVDADEAGMLTDGEFGNATPRMDAVEQSFRGSLHPLIASGTVPVLTGFFGCDDEGHVTTFGRGGSDFSASIVAAALQADRLEVWKDVDGFLTADPDTVPEAVPLAHMTYDEAAELAYVGARVLHPRTVEPVKARGIPIHVRNTRRPEAEGSVIAAQLPADVGGLRSAAVKHDLAILRLYGPGMAYTPGIGEEVFTVLGRADINVYNMAASQASFALLIDGADLERGRKLLSDHVHGVIQRVDGIRDRSLVCVVGQGLGDTHGVAGRIFTAVGEAGVNVEMISVGASDIALNFVVHSDDAKACVEAIHDAFLRSDGGNP